MAVIHQQSDENKKSRYSIEIRHWDLPSDVITFYYWHINVLESVSVTENKYNIVLDKYGSKSVRQMVKREVKYTRTLRLNDKAYLR